MSTPGRRAIKPGEWACFYAAGSHEVLAFGRISGDLDHKVSQLEWPGPNPYNPEIYRVPLADVQWVEPAPVLDAAMRARLDAFHGKDPAAIWSWLVQTTHRVSHDDFLRLTNQKSD